MKAPTIDTKSPLEPDSDDFLVQTHEAVAPSRTPGKVQALLMSLRPHQWVKNSLIFGGLIFSRSLLQWESVWLSLGAFVTFCMASGGVYLLNDLRDLEADRQHPTKRLRPLAAGTVRPATAGGVMGLLLTGALLLAFVLQPAFHLILSLYVLLNIVYSLGLKRMVIVDVMVVAMGFVLRAVAGAIIVGAQPSPWLVLCTLMLALMIGFGKRRHELTLLQGEAWNHRRSLEDYSVPFLDLMMAISGAASVMTYALYTMAVETVARFGSHSLVFTTPWVLYGVFRYLYLVYQHTEGGDPARLLVTDRPTLMNAVLWVGVVCLILYGPTGWQPW